MNRYAVIPKHATIQLRLHEWEHTTVIYGNTVFWCPDVELKCSIWYMLLEYRAS